MAFGHAVEGIDDSAAHQAEVAGVAWYGNVDQPFEQAIEQARTAFLEPGLAFAIDPLAIDDIVSLPGKSEHFGQQFGRVLKIGVDDENMVAPAQRQTGSQGKLMPVIAGQVDADDMGRARGMGTDRGPGAVVRAVVDQNDFIGTGRRRFADRLEPGEQGVDHGLFVVAGTTTESATADRRPRGDSAPRSSGTTP
jgi:hypothetical protein